MSQLRDRKKHNERQKLKYGKKRLQVLPVNFSSSFMFLILHNILPLRLPDQPVEAGAAHAGFIPFGKVTPDLFGYHLRGAPAIR